MMMSVVPKISQIGKSGAVQYSHQYFLEIGSSEADFRIQDGTTGQLSKVQIKNHPPTHAAGYPQDGCLWGKFEGEDFWRIIVRDYSSYDEDEEYNYVFLVGDEFRFTPPNIRPY